MMQKKACLLAITVVVVLLLLASAAECIQRDPYQVLGVRRSATQKEITKAFRRLSRQYHPDKNPSKDATAKFQEISAAYDYLTDPARQNKPWEWDFTDDSSTSARRGRGSGTPYSVFDAFDAFRGTYHFVLDLDPMRLIEMVRGGFEQHVQKHHTMFESLWKGTVDRSVCQALQAGWKLARLLEPPLLFAAQHRLLQYKPGQWRTWASSGVLLELGFWVARQPPCLQHAHTSSSTTGAPPGSAEHNEDDSAGGGMHSGPVTDIQRLVELQQQLHTQRKLRQQLLYSSPSSRSSKAQPRSKGGKASSHSTRSGSVMLDSFDADLSQLQRLQGRLLWWALLLAGCYLMLHDRQLLLGGGGLVAAGVWSLFWGVGASEGAVEALQAALDSNSWTGWLIGVWYVAACGSLCLLLPLVLAGCVLLLVTWLWAAVSCSSIAMTPCLSRMGFALWIGLQLWTWSGGELLRGGALMLGVCYLIYRRPSLAFWWLHLLFSPVLFGWHLLRFIALSWGYWLGITSTSPAAAAAAAAAARKAKKQLEAAQQRQAQEQQQQQQNQEVGGAAIGMASPDRLASNKRNRILKPYQTANRTAAAVPGAAASQQAATAAAATGGPAGPAPGGSAAGSAAAALPSMRRRAARASLLTVWCIFHGPWWPTTFNPVDLAFTCHWWLRMLGWELPWRALTAASIACKLTFAVAALALAAAAFGADSGWLTVARLVQLVLLRVGAAVGVLCAAYSVLDDVARLLEPLRYKKRQQKRGKLQQPWQQPLRKQRQREAAAAVAAASAQAEAAVAPAAAAPTRGR